MDAFPLAADLVVVAGSIFLAGIFSGAETGSYRGLNRLRLRLRARQGDPRAARLQALLADHSLFIGTMLVGTNVATHLASLALTRRFERLGLGAGWLPPELAAALALVLPLLVLGEILPKGLFHRRANTLMYRVTGFLAAARLVFWPITWLMRGLTRLVRRLGRGGREERDWTAVDRAALVARLERPARGVSLAQQRMARAVLSLGARPVSELMTPLDQAQLLPATARGEEFLDFLRRHPATRVALHGPAGREEIVGMVHLFDLLDEGARARPLGELARALPRLKGATRLREALTWLRRARRELAVVDDEFGRAVGLVRLEDLAAALVRARAGG